MKKMLLLVAILLSAGAQAEQAKDKPASDDAMWAEVPKRLFAKAVLLKDAPVIEDSKGCLWGITDNNPSGRLVSIELTEKGGTKQICRKAK